MISSAVKRETKLSMYCSTIYVSPHCGYTYVMLDWYYNTNTHTNGLCFDSLGVYHIALKYVSCILLHLCFFNILVGKLFL